MPDLLEALEVTVVTPRMQRSEHHATALMVAPLPPATLGGLTRDHNLVLGVDQMRQVYHVGQHSTPPAGMGQGTDEQERPLPGPVPAGRRSSLSNTSVFLPVDARSRARVAGESTRRVERHTCVRCAPPCRFKAGGVNSFATPTTPQQCPGRREQNKQRKTDD